MVDCATWGDFRTKMEQAMNGVRLLPLFNELEKLDSQDLAKQDKAIADLPKTSEAYCRALVRAMRFNGAAKTTYDAVQEGFRHLGRVYVALKNAHGELSPVAQNKVKEFADTANFEKGKYAGGVRGFLDSRFEIYYRLSQCTEPLVTDVDNEVRIYLAFSWVST